MSTDDFCVVGCNDEGYRVGTSHPRTKYSQETVDRIRELHEDEGFGYKRIAVRLNIPRSTVKKICLYIIRAQAPVKYKRVKIKRDDG